MPPIALPSVCADVAHRREAPISLVERPLRSAISMSRWGPAAGMPLSSAISMRSRGPAARMREPTYVEHPLALPYVCVDGPRRLNAQTYIRRTPLTGPGGRKAPTHLRRTSLARPVVCADGTRRMKCPRRPHSLAINRRRLTRRTEMSQSTYGGHGWKALTNLRRTLIALPSLWHSPSLLLASFQNQYAVTRSIS